MWCSVVHATRDGCSLGAASTFLHTQFPCGSCQKAKLKSGGTRASLGILSEFRITPSDQASRSVQAKACTAREHVIVHDEMPGRCHSQWSAVR